MKLSILLFGLFLLSRPSYGQLWKDTTAITVPESAWHKMSYVQQLPWKFIETFIFSDKPDTVLIYCGKDTLRTRENPYIWLIHHETRPELDSLADQIWILKAEIDELKMQLLRERGRK